MTRNYLYQQQLETPEFLQFLLLRPDILDASVRFRESIMTTTNKDPVLIYFNCYHSCKKLQVNLLVKIFFDIDTPRFRFTLNRLKDAMDAFTRPNGPSQYTTHSCQNILSPNYTPWKPRNIYTTEPLPTVEPFFCRLLFINIKGLPSYVQTKRMGAIKEGVDAVSGTNQLTFQPRMTDQVYRVSRPKN